MINAGINAYIPCLFFQGSFELLKPPGGRPIFPMKGLDWGSMGAPILAPKIHCTNQDQCQEYLPRLPSWGGQVSLVSLVPAALDGPTFVCLKSTTFTCLTASSLRQPIWSAYEWSTMRCLNGGLNWLVGDQYPTIQWATIHIIKPCRSTIAQQQYLLAAMTFTILRFQESLLPMRITVLGHHGCQYDSCIHEEWVIQVV